MKKIGTNGQKLWKDKRVFAAARAVLALLIALGLVWASGFAFVYQLGGATEVTDGGELKVDTYVRADIKWVMDIVGTETARSTGKTLYYYAVAPVGNRFTLLRIGADQLADVQALKAETTALLVGESKAMSIHMPVRGMVAQAEQGAFSLLSEWFNNNVEWMTIAGVVGKDPSSADYLVDECILVDQVGNCGAVWSAVMSIAALVFVLYALVELVLLATGYYKESRAAARLIRKVQREKAKAKAERAAQRAAEKAAAKEAAKAEMAEKKPEDKTTEAESKPEEKAEEPTVEDETAVEATAENETAAETAGEEPAAEEATVEESVEEPVAEETIEETVEEEEVVPTVEEILLDAADGEDNG